MAIDCFRINERSSFQITFTVVDEAETVVPLADITEATLTLWDMDQSNPSISPSELWIINGRDEQDVLNANNVTIHPTSGLVTWAVQPEDNTIQTSRRQVERHRAEFHITFARGNFWQGYELEVVNMGRPV